MKWSEFVFFHSALRLSVDFLGTKVIGLGRRIFSLLDTTSPLILSTQEDTQVDAEENKVANEKLQECYE